MVSLLFGCRKYDSLPTTLGLNDAQLKEQFFNTSTTEDIIIKKLAADIRRQDSIYKFLPAFVKKNGIPRWDKVIYSTNQSASGKQLSTYGVNAAGSLTKQVQNNTTEGSQGIFLIPLQAQNTNDIQSYIVTYKHNDSVYSYRLYNRDSLNAIQPQTSDAKNNLLNMQAVFGYFEQTVNNRDEITIASPVKGKIKNVAIAFDAPKNNRANSTQSLNGTMASVSCAMTIAVTISYSLEITVDGNTIYVTETFTSTLTIIIDCTGGGSCNCATPKDNIIDGAGSTGNSNGNWWDYGTGYPYFPWNPGGGIGAGSGIGPYEPDWSWWWTGGGGGGGYDPDFDPSNYPETFEILLFENDYRNQMSTQELQIFDNMSRTNQLQYLYNAKYASDKAQELYPNSVHNGNGDAFRHALFSGLNSKVLGVALAKQLGDAHELIPNNPLLENQMDLFNNQVGRDQFVYLQNQGQAGHFFKEALVISLMQKVQNGELQRLDPLDVNSQIIPGVTQLVSTN